MSQEFSIEETGIEGCLIIHSKVFEDVRGSFINIWNEVEMNKFDLPKYWPQDNFIASNKNTARGLHIQRNNPQGRLVTCVNGDIVDICLDVRVGSKTFGKSLRKIISPGYSIYLPPGTAHGFVALTDCKVYSKCTSLYDEKSDGGINMNDPEINLKNLAHGRVFSTKDLSLPTLSQWLEGRN